MSMDLLKVRIPSIIYRIAQLLEIVVSGFVILAVVLSLGSIVTSLLGIAQTPGDPGGLHTFLGVAFNVVIGVEFLKMLARHNMSSCIEVLLFAIARQMVIEHTTAAENLLMILAIALLFAIRKFLFIPGLDDKQAILENRIHEEQEAKKAVHK